MSGSPNPIDLAGLPPNGINYQVGAIYYNTNVDFICPELYNLLEHYETIRHCLEGEFKIKREGVRYLPMPNAHDKTEENLERYKAYRERAVFYNATARTLRGLVGNVFLRAPIIDLPPVYDTIKEDATGSGVSLIQLAKKVAEGVVAYGRKGLLVDYPPANGPLSVQEIAAGNMRPMITTYEPWDIVNWRTVLIGAKKVLSLVVLREWAVVESGPFAQIFVKQYRVLRLENSVYTVQIWQEETDEKFRIKDKAGVQMDMYRLVAVINPIDAGGKPLQEIPFMFVGAHNNDIAVDQPPMFDLARVNIAHYRNSADYEESCYICGQPTLVIKGITKEWLDSTMGGKVVLGSRSAIPLPVGGDAELIQAKDNTMPKEAMEAKERQMVALGAKLVEQKSVQRTATEATNDHMSEQSLLANAAANVSQAMLWALKVCATFLGGSIDIDKLQFELNTEFDLILMSPDDRKQLLSEWQSGAITFSEYRHNLHRAGVAQLDDKDAMAEIKQNPPLVYQLPPASISVRDNVSG